MPNILQASSKMRSSSLPRPYQEFPIKSKAQILRERAQKIAHKSGMATQVGQTLPVMEFQLEYEKYAMNVKHIQEVCILKEYSSIPGVPRYILGITNLRGRVIAIVDLKHLFSLPRKGLAYHNKVIVVGNEKILMGLLADEILGLRTVALSEIQTQMHALTGKRAEYFAGVTRDWTSILDVEKILTDKSLVVDESIPLSN